MAPPLRPPEAPAFLSMGGTSEQGDSLGVSVLAARLRLASPSSSPIRFITPTACLHRAKLPSQHHKYMAYGVS